jgi:hypothetical protein
MAKSLEVRLREIDGEEDFLQDVEWFGRSKALDMWDEKLGGFHDFVSLQRFLERETGDPDFGKIPKLDTTTYKNQTQVLLEGFADFVLRTKTQLEAKEKYIKELEMKIKYLEYQNKAQYKDSSIYIQEAIERVMETDRE